tara:strand:- start:34 stop:336 length:303 start_codon:yes stop_codon:yes gene_type:complete
LPYKSDGATIDFKGSSEYEIRTPECLQFAYEYEISLATIITHKEFATHLDIHVVRTQPHIPGNRHPNIDAQIVKEGIAKSGDQWLRHKDRSVHSKAIGIE